MASNLLTIAIEFVTFASVAFLSAQFVSGLFTRARRRPSRPATVAAPVTAAPVNSPDPWLQSSDLDNEITEIAPVAAAPIVPPVLAIAAARPIAGLLPAARTAVTFNPIEWVHVTPDPVRVQLVEQYWAMLATITAAARPMPAVVSVPLPAIVLPTTVNGLRAFCKDHGIRWNRAGKGGKHLTRAEMIAALSDKLEIA